jgi:PAS domain S-box-containing protein
MSNVKEIKTGLDLESVLLAQEIADQEDFSTVIVNASQDGIIGYDTQCRYTLWSPAMERLSGMTAKEVMGRVAFDVFPFLKQEGLDHSYRVSLQGTPITSPVFRYVVPETGLAGYSIQQNFPLFDENGEVSGGIAVVRDVTLVKNKFDAMLQHNRELELRIKELEAEISNLRGQKSGP